MRRQTDCFNRSSAHPATNFRPTLNSTNGKLLTSASESHSGPASSIAMATLWRRSCLAASIARSRLRMSSALLTSTMSPSKPAWFGSCLHNRPIASGSVRTAIGKLISVSIGPLCAKKRCLFNGTTDHGIRDSVDAAAALRRKISRWKDSPSRMVNAQERFGAAHDERTRVDFRLVPKLEPTSRTASAMSTTGPDDSSVRSVAMLSRKPSLLRGMRSGGSRAMPSFSARSCTAPTTTESRGANGKTFPSKSLSASAWSAGFGCAGRQPEHHEVGRSGIESRAELGSLDAFLDHEAEFTQRLAEEASNVLLAVGDPYKRRAARVAGSSNASPPLFAWSGPQRIVLKREGGPLQCSKSATVNGEIVAEKRPVIGSNNTKITWFAGGTRRRRRASAAPRRSPAAPEAGR